MHVQLLTLYITLLLKGVYDVAPIDIVRGMQHGPQI